MSTDSDAMEWEKQQIMTTQFFDVVETYYDEYAKRRLIKRKVTGSLLLEKDADLLIADHKAAAAARDAVEALREIRDLDATKLWPEEVGSIMREIARAALEALEKQP